MVRKVAWVSILILMIVSCKKKEDRSCWKGHGEETSIEIPLDSVGNWVLNKKIKYRIFEDSTRKLVVKGGVNMVNQIEAVNDNYQMTISNKNKCDFMRSADRSVEVEIHYPHIKEMYIEPSDSVVFETTMTPDSLWIEVREAGGSMVIDVDTKFVSVVVSHGTANYVISGQSQKAEIKVQHNGYADARDFYALSYFAYQNSTADLYIDIENSGALVVIDGTGNVYSTGTPIWLIEEGKGTGEHIQQ